MLKFFKPLISFLRLIREVRNIKLAYALIPRQYTPKYNISVQGENQPNSLAKDPVQYSPSQINLFESDGDMLLKFMQAQCKMETVQNNHFLTLTQNNSLIRFYIRNYDNLQVLEEVFINQLYAFQSKGEFVVCDVGANIGAASLYFASFENIAKVYGYEPFPETLVMAEKNIQLNPALSSKIELFGHGLGAKDETKAVPKPKAGFLGGTTSDFMIDSLPGSLKGSTISIEIKGISTILNTIRKTHPDKKIILKLDCEGAEYEIMDSLVRNHELDKIAICIIEYHLLGNASIVQKLVSNHFTVFSPGGDLNQSIGMVYAVRHQ